MVFRLTGSSIVLLGSDHTRLLSYFMACLVTKFVLVTRSGKTYTKTNMLEDARRGDVYERNDEESQTVRLWGDTAVVTAKLWEKYTSNGKSYDHKFWFSDTYVRTRSGWKYVFGQSSLPLPSAHRSTTGDLRMRSPIAARIAKVVK
jgi:hypothetical protein